MHSIFRNSLLVTCVSHRLFTVFSKKFAYSTDFNQEKNVGDVSIYSRFSDRLNKP